jgi:hypothetical protein
MYMYIYIYIAAFFSPEHDFHLQVSETGQKVQVSGVVVALQEAGGAVQGEHGPGGGE